MSVPAALSSARRPKWLVPVAIIGGIFLLLILPLIGSYNGMVDKESSVDESFANLDAQLQRRNDLIPNLVGAVKGILGQEQAVFGEIARARTNYAGAGSVDEKAEASGEVSSALARLLVVMENYPQLQSAQNVRDLQVQLEGTENRIVQTRQNYNGTVTDYNKHIRRFPRSLTAGIFGFDRKPLFEADATSREVPPVEFGNTTPTS